MRRASLVFGSTTFAVSTVLAVFFLGLACGSYLFGRVGQRTSRPLQLYALIEIGLGLFALVSPYAFDLADNCYGAVYRVFAERSQLLFLVRILLVSLIILPPTILMGATLPLFCRQYVVSDSRVASAVGLLYGVNTLGAALGCATAGLVLLPAIGLWRTVLVGAALNVLCGIAVGVLRISKEAAPEIRGEASSEPVTRTGTGSRAPVSILFFSVGFVALGAEVLWTRYLGLLIHNTVYTYTLTLTVVLVGIVLGSILASRFSDRSASRARYFGALQVLTGLSILTLMMLPPNFWRGTGKGLWMYFVLLLPPAVLSGASFPLAVRMVVAEASNASVGTGRMAAINTLGGILGSLLVGFVGLPLLGLKTSLLSITGVSLMSGFAAWIWLNRTDALFYRGAAIVISSLVWFGIPLVTGTRIPADFLGSREHLVDFREGVGSNLAVVQDGEVLALEIDRMWQGESIRNHQAIAAHVPMLLHPDPKSVVVVGVGVGQTASRFLMYDIDRLQCVDIEPTIFEFIRKHFDAKWMDDERVTQIHEDGRSYLWHDDTMYDVISLELGQILRPGVAFFYTADFYHRARKRLNPGGLLVQFVPLQLLTTPQVRDVVRTFLDAFPQSLLWYNRAELLLIGVNDERFKLNSAPLERLASNEQVHRDLKTSYWGSSAYWLNRPHVFLGGYLMGTRGLANLADSARLYRDDLPVLDYATSQAADKEWNEIPTLADVREHLEPVKTLLNFELPPNDISAIADIREKNLATIEIRRLIRRVSALKPSTDSEQIIALLLEATRLNREHVVINEMLWTTLIGQRRYEEARAYYAESVRIRPQDARAQYRLAIALHNLRRIDEAIQHYTAAIALRPNDAEMRNSLGVALAQSGNLTQAVQHLEEAVRLRSGDTNAKQNLDRVRTDLESAPRR